MQKSNCLIKYFKPIFQAAKTGLFLILLTTSINVFAYNIRVEISNCPDYYIFLGKHHGPDFVIIDSLPSNNGIVNFKGESNLEKGVYFIVIPPQTRFDFIIADDQNFVIKTDARNVIEKLEISGEKQYSVFADFQREIASINKTRAQLNMESEFFKTYKPDTIAFIQAKIDSLNIIQSNMYSNYRSKTLAKEFLNKILGLLEPLFVPDSIESLRYSNPDKQYNYYKNHWLDRIDFDEPGLLNTPAFVFHQLIEDYCYYFMDTRINNPDDVYPDIDSLIIKTQDKPLYNQYILSYLIARYEAPKDLRLEAYLVYVYRNYFLVKKPNWVDDYAYAIMKFRIESIQYNVIGNTAPNLTLPDIEGNYHSIYDMHGKFKLLLFWEPDCDICNETALILAGNYQRLQELNVEIMAILSNSDNNEWTDFVFENAIEWINVYDPENESNFEILYGTYKTPRLFILDENNIIIGKDIKPGSVYDFIQGVNSKNESELNRFIFGQ